MTRVQPSRLGIGALFVLCGAIFLEAIDITMLNVALPAVRAELGLSTAMLSGAVSAYVLGYGGLMLLGGRVADLLGRRRVFLASLAVFLVFSALGGFAGEGWTLLVARFVKGVAAAFMTPAGLSLITTAVPEGRQRNRALLIYAGVGAGGYSLGLVIGALLAAVDWRWVFFAPAVLSGLILALGLAVLPRDGVVARPDGRTDLAGAITITSAMLLLAYGVVRLEHGLAGSLGALLGGLVLVGVFVLVERRSAAPLVRLGIFASAPLVRANLAALLFVGSFFGFFFLVTLYLQELRGWSALQTASVLVLAGVDAILAPTLAPPLVNRFGTARVVFGGILLGTLGYLLFLPVGLDWTYLAMFPSTLLLGLAFSLVYGPLTIAATDGVAADEQGLASGLLNTSIQFGTALGLSAVTAVSVAAGTPGDSGLDALRAALWIPLAGAALAALIIATGLRRPVEGR
ncbi:MFS transporter [Pseudonocardia eucalypti]|uniref:MFS transporter n=1 Tax=Pseudonocardia eucalypti TaxID=648755 RepID=A0ABP9Q5P0_9PSEU